MKTEFYIKFKAKKIYNGFALSGAPKTSTKKMNTAPDEFCVKMNIEIPDDLFEKPIITITGKIGCDIPKEQGLIFANEAKTLIENSMNLRVEIKEN